MKTLKITEEAHRDLTIVCYQEYKKTGLKITYSELIEQLIILYHKNKREKYYGKK